MALKNAEKRTGWLLNRRVKSGAGVLANHSANKSSIATQLLDAADIFVEIFRFQVSSTNFEQFMCETFLRRGLLSEQ